MRYDYDYNEEGLLTAKYQSRDAAPRPVLRYEYDVEGRTVARTDAGGTRVEYAYDPLGRVVAIRQGENEMARYTYAAGNRIASMLYGNGVQTAYEYTPEGQVSRLHTRAADGTVLLDNRYAYDRSGNTIGCYGTQDQAEYRYDALDRLVEARYAGYGTEKLAYDEAGNRISRVWNGQRTSYTYDTRNRLLSLIEEALQEENEEQGRANGRTSGKNIRYAYDAQGNLIQEHQGEQTTSYVYDAFNRTIRVEQADGRIVQHGYDPEGLRSRLDTDGTVRHFVHDGWHVVNELDETERIQASYIRGHEWLSQLDDQGNVAYYVNNIHSDVTHLTGSQGQILNAYTYDAFGNMLSAREQRVNPFRYAGEMQDALTGHYYLRARFYNPIIARFTQEDTYRGDGLNLYAYVANNPIRYVDPSGYAKAGSGGSSDSCLNKGNKHASNESVGDSVKDSIPPEQLLKITHANIPNPRDSLNQKIQVRGGVSGKPKSRHLTKYERNLAHPILDDITARSLGDIGARDRLNSLNDHILENRNNGQNFEGWNSVYIRDEHGNNGVMRIIYKQASDGIDWNVIQWH
ncbi:RHS repeat domain-containing protein [Paenibacillus hubeiensis]|uniref:RHS repeat domain-containing protein n=1 Tax=Paenibacillus hubeiensis TaxID=3077330 RepID=UPI0031B9D2C9